MSGRWWFKVKFELRFRFVQPVMCKFGRHDSFDVLETDGGVRHAFCMSCMTETSPLRPRPADPVQAQWIADVQNELDEYLAREDDA